MEIHCSIEFKVKGVLMDSKLPLETLGKIWDLADQDKDGMLDRHEFIAVSCIIAVTKANIISFYVLQEAMIQL